MHPGIGSFQFLAANGRREGGRAYWAVFSSCGRVPLAWAAGPGGAGPLYTVRFGDLGSETGGSCRVGRGQEFEVVLNNSYLYGVVKCRA